MEYKKGLTLILIIAGLVISLYLSYLQISGAEPLCLTGQGCKIIQNSVYNETFGIKNSYIGVTSFLFFLLIFLLSLKEKKYKKLFLYATIIGAIFSIRFIYLQFFVIKALCSNCLAVDTITLIIAALSIHDRLKRG